MEFSARKSSRRWLARATSLLMLSLMLGAQGQPESPRRPDSAVPRAELEEIRVTARKKERAEPVQRVPLAISTLTPKQLASFNFRRFDDIALVAPNVTLDQNGNSRTQALFTIRGAGINSAIPSIEPAVGVFINGVYQGTPAGTVVDDFDLAGINILRGPQGTLFGRNVTGGAVLVETQRPSGNTGGKLSAALETGAEYRVSGAWEAPLVADSVDFRLAGLWRRDRGWFTNQATGAALGESETTQLRPTLQFHLAPNIEQTLILDWGRDTGDGAANQALRRASASRDFTLNINQPGFNNYRWTGLTSETRIGVGADRGSITNILGWRRFSGEYLNDIDATPNSLFELYNSLRQEQFSNELRYAGRFFADRLDLTVGLFYFRQNLRLIEERDIFNPAEDALRTVGGGGKQSHDTWGLFAQGEWMLRPNLSFTVGLRGSREDKAAQINALSPERLCSRDTEACNFADADIDDDNQWHSLSPRLALQYQASERTLLYASYAEATRSGGFNLRLTAANDPGQFDQEDVASIELGIKADVSANALVNLTLFDTRYDDLQRTVLRAVGTEVIQNLTNAADARGRGAEAEITLRAGANLGVMLTAGYTDMRYRRVFFDLNGDGVVDDIDRDLESPRVSPWSWGSTLTWESRAPWGGQLNARMSYFYRDAAPADDANDLFLQTRHDLSANVSWTLPNKALVFALYGRNLANRVIDTGPKLAIPQFPSGGLRTIGEGRAFGVAMRYRW